MSDDTLDVIAAMDEELREYTLNHAVSEAISGRDWEFLARLLGDLGFLQAKCCSKWKTGVGSLMADLNAARKASVPDSSQRAAMGSIARVIELEQQNLDGWDLGAQPAFFVQQVRNRAAALQFTSLCDQASAYLRNRNLPYLEQVWIAASNSRELLKTLVAPRCQLHAVRLSDDGRFAYTAGTDQLLRIWDVDSATQVRAIPMDAHHDRVRCLAITQSGDLAVTGGRDKRVCIWNLKTGGLASSLAGHDDWVVDVAISSNGEFAASASYDHTVRLWDCRNYRLLQVLKSFKARVRGVAFTPDNQTLLAGDEQGWLYFFAVGNPSSPRKLRFQNLVIDRIAVDPEGRLAALSCEPSAVVELRDRLARKQPDIGFGYWEDEFRGGVAGMQLHLVDLAVPKPAGSFPLDDRGARSIAFTHNAGSLLACQTDGRVRIYEVPSGKPIGTLSAHEKAAAAVAFAPGAAIAASAGNDGTVRIWDFGRAPQSDAGRGYQASVSTVGVSANGSAGVSVSTEGELRFWSLKDGELLDHQDLNEGVALEARMKSFALTNAADLLAAASDTSVLLYGFLQQSSEVLDIAVDAGDSILSVFISPDGMAACCVSNSGVLYSIDVASRQVRRVCAQDCLSRAVPIPGQCCVLTSYDDKPETDIRDRDTGEVRSTLHSGTNENVQTFAVTPNGTAAFVGYDGGPVRLWRLADRQQVSVLSMRANALAISPVVGSSRVAVADSQRMLTLWNVKEGRILGQAAPIGRCFALAITPHGDGLFAGDTAGNICLLRYVAR